MGVCASKNRSKEITKMANNHPSQRQISANFQLLTTKVLWSSNAQGKHANSRLHLQHTTEKKEKSGLRNSFKLHTKSVNNSLTCVMYRGKANPISDALYNELKNTIAKHDSLKKMRVNWESLPGSAVVPCIVPFVSYGRYADEINHTVVEFTKTARELPSSLAIIIFRSHGQKDGYLPPASLEKNYIPSMQNRDSWCILDAYYTWSDGFYGCPNNKSTVAEVVKLILQEPVHENRPLNPGYDNDNNPNARVEGNSTSATSNPTACFEGESKKASNDPTACFEEGEFNKVTKNPTFL